MFDILTTDYPLIQQMRRVAHALDVLQYSLILNADTIKDMRELRPVIVDHIEEWEGLAF